MVHQNYLEFSVTMAESLKDHFSPCCQNIEKNEACLRSLLKSWQTKFPQSVIGMLISLKISDKYM